MRQRFTRVLLAIALLAPAAAHAKVFWRWNATEDSVRALESSGGKIVYAADVTVNTGRGRLTVLNYDQSLDAVVRMLRRAFPGAEFAHQGGNLAIVRAASRDRSVRLVAAELGGLGRTVVFDLDQSVADAEASARPPEGAALKDLPPYPAADAVFFAQDDRAAMGALVSRTAAGPETVRRFYDQALRGAGWTAATSPEGPAASSLQVYLKRERVCCVLVSPAREEGLTLITVLHKERGIEY
jgi:putative intracellular protease/amidase